MRGVRRPRYARVRERVVEQGFLAGLSLARIAREEGCSAWTVRDRLESMGWIRRGERVAQAWARAQERTKER